MANTYLQRNMANSLTTDWTVSMWVKRNEIVRQQMLFSAYNNSSYDTEAFFDGDKLNFRNKRNGSFVFQVKTNRLFRDVNSFYHLVFQFHASGDSGVYAKIFVNGVQETDLNVNTQGSGETTWNNDKSHSIGSTVNGGADHFNGIISHMHFASTGIYAPSVFGEYDANGVWKIKTSPTFTPGSNGFTILKDGNTITDQSTNSNDFSLGSGTLTKTEDNASNLFATWNSLSPTASNFTLSNGNTKVYRSGTVNPGQAIYGQTIMPTTGKWYVEAKIVEQPGGDAGRLGIANFESIPGDMVQTPQSSSPSSVNAVEVSFGTSGVVFFTINGTDTENSSAPSFSNGNIIMLAVDCDNGKFYVGSQGNWWNYSSSATGGDPTSGSGYVSNSSDLFNGSPICFHQGHSTGTSKTSALEWNFGNGYFGTTAVSSAGTNASGIGIFEYDVPTGYTALSTKGLNL